MRRMINLMPATYQRRIAARRIRRQCIISTVMGLMIMCAIAAHQHAMISRQRRTASDLRDRVQALENLRAEAEERHRDADEIDQELRRQRQLGLPVNVSDVIRVVASLMNDRLVLTDLDLAVAEREISTSVIEKVRARGGRSREKPRTVQFLVGEIDGLGINDEEVTQFMNRLDLHQLFSEVEIKYVRPAEVPDKKDLREFRLVFEIDLSLDYVVEVASADVVTGPEQEAGSP